MFKLPTSRTLQSWLQPYCCWLPPICAFMIAKYSATLCNFPLLLRLHNPSTPTSPTRPPPFSPGLPPPCPLPLGWPHISEQHSSSFMSIWTRCRWLWVQFPQKTQIFFVSCSWHAKYLLTSFSFPDWPQYSTAFFPSLFVKPKHVRNLISNFQEFVLRVSVHGAIVLPFEEAHD